MANLITEPYLIQKARWPQTGKHILAQFDDNSIIVYQAYRATIGHFAARNGYFGGNHFSLERMTWIKPNFLWMMYRSGWAQKENQEVVLAIRLKRSAFDEILSQAVHSTYVEAVYHSHEQWKQAVNQSAVRLQWDPDHDPTGAKQKRRAIQLGMRGPALKKYAQEWIIDIEDISDFVHTQYQHIQNHTYEQLLLPKEEVYPVQDIATRRKLFDTSIGE